LSGGKHNLMKNNNSWSLLTLPFNAGLKDALEQQHHAAQYIAMVGKHLIPQQSDDSNTNMEFDPETGMLVGNPLSNGMKVGLHLDSLNMAILDQSGNEIKTLPLNGKTKKQGFVDMKEALTSLGVDTGTLKNELHYDIPAHALDKGATFLATNQQQFRENLLYRSNARLVMQEVVSGLKNAEPVKIWPHHFDTGSFVSFAKNEKGELIQTIGLGMAIPDSMIEEPYYYLSFWDADPKNKPGNFAALTHGKWMMPEWNGAVLSLSDILQKTSADEQHKLVFNFFNEAVKAAVNFLEKK